MGDIEFINKCVLSESFSARTVSRFLSVESEFIDCVFENMKIRDVCFGGGAKQSRYVNCSFDGSVFSSSTPGVARFENCSFQNVKVKKFFCVDIEMIDCTVSGEVEKGNFVGIHRDVDGSVSVNEFRGNDFSGLKLVDVGFFGIDLKSQRLPSGDDYLVIEDVSGFLSKARVEALSIKNKQLSDLIFKVLNIIELESEGGNNQMFLDKRSFPKNLQDAVSSLFSFAR